MEQPLMLQSDCVDCPFYDGFGQCIQYGNITEEIISKCEFNNKVMKANEAPEKIYLQPSVIEQLPHQNIIYTKPLADNSIEYTRTDAFIEKACAFIRKRLIFDDNAWYIEGEVTVKDQVIGNFKDYMKGE